MNTAEALDRYTLLQQELTALLLLLASEDPEPQELDECHARIAAAMLDLDALQPGPGDLESLTVAASETDRLARATATAASQRRACLTAEQAQLARQQGALAAYRPISESESPQFIDRRS